MERETVDGLFNKIYDDTYQACLIYVTCKCSNTQDISDILQETYLSIYRILAEKGTEYIQNPEAYVIRVAKTNLSKRYRFQDKLKNVIPLFGEKDDDEEYNVADLKSDTFINSLESQVVQRETLHQIWCYLKNKPQGIQKVFLLFYYADMTIAEIARVLKLHESTVKTRLYRTTREIREKFGQEGAQL